MLFKKHNSDRRWLSCIVAISLTWSPVYAGFLVSLEPDPNHPNHSVFKTTCKLEHASYKKKDDMNWFFFKPNESVLNNHSIYTYNIDQHIDDIKSANFLFQDTEKVSAVIYNKVDMDALKGPLYDMDIIREETINPTNILNISFTNKFNFKNLRFFQNQRWIEIQNKHVEPLFGSYNRDKKHQIFLNSRFYKQDQQDNFYSCPNVIFDHRGDRNREKREKINKCVNNAIVQCRNSINLSDADQEFNFLSITGGMDRWALNDIVLFQENQQGQLCVHNIILASSIYKNKNERVQNSRQNVSDKYLKNNIQSKNIHDADHLIPHDPHDNVEPEDDHFEAQQNEHRQQHVASTNNQGRLNTLSENVLPSNNPHRIFYPPVNDTADQDDENDCDLNKLMNLTDNDKKAIKLIKKLKVAVNELELVKDNIKKLEQLIEVLDLNPSVLSSAYRVFVNNNKPEYATKLRDILSKESGTIIPLCQLLGWCTVINELKDPSDTRNLAEILSDNEYDLKLSSKVQGWTTVINISQDDQNKKYYRNTLFDILNKFDRDIRLSLKIKGWTSLISNFKDDQRVKKSIPTLFKRLFKNNNSDNVDQLMRLGKAILYASKGDSNLKEYIKKMKEILESYKKDDNSHLPNRLALSAAILCNLRDEDEKIYAEYTMKLVDLYEKNLFLDGKQLIVALTAILNASQGEDGIEIIINKLDKIAQYYIKNVTDIYEDKDFLRKLTKAYTAIVNNSKGNSLRKEYIKTLSEVLQSYEKKNQIDFDTCASAYISLLNIALPKNTCSDQDIENRRIDIIKAYLLNVKNSVLRASILKAIILSYFAYEDGLIINGKQMHQKEFKDKVFEEFETLMKFDKECQDNKKLDDFYKKECEYRYRNTPYKKRKTEDNSDYKRNRYSDQKNNDYYQNSFNSDNRYQSNFSRKRDDKREDKFEGNKQYQNDTQRYSNQNDTRRYEDDILHKQEEFATSMKSKECQDNQNLMRFYKKEFEFPYSNVPYKKRKTEDNSDYKRNRYSDQKNNDYYQNSFNSDNRYQSNFSRKRDDKFEGNKQYQNDTRRYEDDILHKQIHGPNQRMNRSHYQPNNNR
jgi:hypothetical protein